MQDMSGIHDNWRYELPLLRMQIQAKAKDLKIQRENDNSHGDKTDIMRKCGQCNGRGTWFATWWATCKSKCDRCGGSGVI